jgi:hypothetical protein
VFSLVKWYLDVVGDDGSAAIGYSARVRWGAIRIGYGSVFLSAPGQTPDEVGSIRSGRAPWLAGETLRWTHRSLGVTGEWAPVGSGFEATLLRTEAGRIHWHCLIPRGRATLTWRDRTVSGWGYAERLELTIPPHRLPFTTLHWGRHLSPRHAVVWIVLDGECPSSRLWLDGHEQPDPRLTDQGASLGGGLALQFGETRSLRDRFVGRWLAETLPALRQRLGPLAGMRELKRLSRSSIMQGEQSLDLGWAIHERVTW